MHNFQGCHHQKTRNIEHSVSVSTTPHVGWCGEYNNDPSSYNLVPSLNDTYFPEIPCVVKSSAVSPRGVFSRSLRNRKKYRAANFVAAQQVLSSLLDWTELPGQKSKCFLVCSRIGLRIEHFSQSISVRAQFLRDDLILFSLNTHDPSGYSIVISEAGPLYVDRIELDTRDRVSVVGRHIPSRYCHGIYPFMALAITMGGGQISPVIVCCCTLQKGAVSFVGPVELIRWSHSLSAISDGEWKHFICKYYKISFSYHNMWCLHLEDIPRCVLGLIKIRKADLAPSWNCSSVVLALKYLLSPWLNITSRYCEQWHRRFAFLVCLEGVFCGARVSRIEGNHS